MSGGKTYKLNYLLKNWPAGTVMVSAQLNKLGIYQQLVNKYVESGWLQSIGRGAFIKSGDIVDWTGGLFAIQTQLGLSAYVSGKTALELSGHTHFFHLGGGGIVWLFGKRGQILPKWFIVNDLQKWHRKIEYITPNLFPEAETIGLEEKQIGRHIITDSVIEKHPGNYKITIASLERAILELLYLIPVKQSLEEAKYLMEGLMTLRPKLLQQLLESCHSIKVKRLFLFLADFCQLPCLEHLDISRINLGRGKRVIGNGGYFVSKYQISIPESFVNTFREELKNYE